MKMRTLYCAALAVLAFSAASCSDDDTPSDPEGTVVLNMLDEQNGKTLLGDSGIYIDKGQNFVTGGGDCLVFTLGKSSGLGAVKVNSFENPVTQAAVQAGYGYAAVRPGALMRFPSGKLALPIGDSRVNYLKFYVVSSLTEENKTVGAAVKYAAAMPESYGLPEYGSTVLTINDANYNHLEQEVSFSLPSKDVECYFLNEGYDISCEQRGKKLVFKLRDWFAHKFELYLRIGGSYTKVYVDVDAPL